MTMTEISMQLAGFQKELADPTLTQDRREEIDKELRRLAALIRTFDLQVNLLRTQETAGQLNITSI